MKVRLFDNPSKIVNWNLVGYVPPNDDQTARSSGHLRARKLLKSLFFTDQILEEVSIPGSQMRVDFLLPNRRLALEVDGAQHRSMSSFFFRNRADFLRAQQRDIAKAEWFAQNGIKLVRLRDDDDDEQWRQQIIGRDG